MEQPKKNIKIDYDSSRGSIRVEADNVTPLEIGNALSNVCASVVKILVDNGTPVDEACKHLTVACSAGIAASRTELMKNDGRTKVHPVS